MSSVTVKANFSHPNGKQIKPLHGVNSGPMTKVFTYDARPLFREAGIPFARLHDVEYPYGSGEFVDIPCIFRNFDADETDPANYNFGLTDEYIARIIEVDCEPLFRLGVSIEHAPVKRHIYPPKDFAKWARICEHIIRHYTEGWADGHHYQIRYWEIWNESDGDPTKQWLGTPEQFYEFYTVAARHLKSAFPHLKIGGCGYCRAIKPFIEDFFAYISSQSEPVPLDFFSWHRYFADIDVLLREAKAADELKARYGYADTESILDEWNYMLDWSKEGQAESYRAMKNHIGAAYYAAVLCMLQQQTNVELATYFEADVVKEFCGIFDVADMCISRACATLKPTKGFYSFKAFGALYRLGDAVDALCEGDGLYACAALGGGKQALLAANYGCDTDCDVTLALSGLASGKLDLHITDEAHTFAQIMTLDIPADGNLTLTLSLKPNSVLYAGSHHIL